ncbi:MAG: ribosomal protein S18-alanine N-acetyltransferase [Caulobacter sp.]|nr:ribosomal protein S18-alanine N-acetyltransferase [Caulobacter sp.]
MTPRRTAFVDARQMAVLHAAAFERPWDEAGFEGLLKAFNVFGRMIDGQGFILCRAVADEAEILTLAVAPAARRQGVARALVEAAVDGAAARGVESLFLEVASDNAAALALYASTGFEPAGLRAAYYASGADALVMRRTLNS